LSYCTTLFTYCHIVPLNFTYCHIVPFNFSIYQRSYWRNLFPCKVFLIISMFFGSATCWKLYFSFLINLSKFQDGIIIKTHGNENILFMLIQITEISDIKVFTASFFHFLLDYFMLLYIVLVSYLSFMNYWYILQRHSIIIMLNYCRYLVFLFKIELVIE